MKIIISVCLLLVLSFISEAYLKPTSFEKRNRLFYKSYFPLSGNNTLVYKTSFGETKSQLINKNGYYLFKNDGDDLTYYQKLLINENGIYVQSTY